MNLDSKRKMFQGDRKPDDIINIKGHLTENICLSGNDCFVAVIKLEGISFENKSNDQLIAYNVSGDLKMFFSQRFEIV